MVVSGGRTRRSFLLALCWLGLAMPLSGQERTLGIGLSVLSAAELAAVDGPTLVFQPLEAPMTVTVNGAVAKRTGHQASPYSSRLHWAIFVSLEPFVVPSQDLKVEITLTPDLGERAVLGPVRLVSRDVASDLVFWRNFWGPQGLTALAWASMVVGFFSLLVYHLGRGLPERERNRYLVYFFLTLAFALSYVNNVLSWDLAPTLLLEKVSRVSMYCWFFCALVANVVFLRPGSGPDRRWIAAAAAFLVPTVLVVLSPTLGEANSWHHLIGLPLMGLALALVLGRSLYWAFRAGDWQAWVLAAFYLAAAGASAVDDWPIYALRYKPGVLLAPYVNFFSDLAFLWLLAHDFNARSEMARRRTLELQTLTSTLEDQVNVRTSELTEAHHNLQFFVSVLAHDLRNQVHGLSLLGTETAEVVRATNAEPKVVRLIDLIRESSLATGQQLESLLLWSQVRLGLVKPVTGPEAAADLLGAVAAEFRPQALARTLNLTVDSDAELVVRCDREMVTTILRNLVANSIRMTPLGGTVSLRAEWSATEILLSVIDTGPGWTTSHGPNSGFGLQIVRALAEAQGFSVETTSHPGKGTRVDLKVPRSKPRLDP
ncbi:MAG: HAMP domain-containing sensor histidine kinase [Spirochaetales bacterium]